MNRAQIQNEMALLEAIKAHRHFTVVGFEPDGELVACIDNGHGCRIWHTF